MVSGGDAADAAQLANLDSGELGMRRGVDRRRDLQDVPALGAAAEGHLDLHPARTSAASGLGMRSERASRAMAGRKCANGMRLDRVAWEGVRGLRNVRAACGYRFTIARRPHAQGGGRGSGLRRRRGGTTRRRLRPACAGLLDLAENGVDALDQACGGLKGLVM